MAEFLAIFHVLGTFVYHDAAVEFYLPAAALWSGSRPVSARVQVSLHVSAVDRVHEFIYCFRACVLDVAFMRFDSSRNQLWRPLVSHLLESVFLESRVHRHLHALNLRVLSSTH